MTMLMGSEVEITELEKIEATRVDGVGVPANGIPILLMKSVDVQPAVEVEKGQRDCPKCDKSFDADHKGDNCTNCGTKLPPVPDDTAKSLPDWHADATALVKKAMVRGKVDETADIDGGTQAIALLGKLIGYESQELAAGHIEEVGDIQMLAQAAQLVTSWLSVERAAQMGDTDAASMTRATALAQSAADDDAAAKAAESAKTQNDLPDSAFAYIEPGGDKDEDGKTTPRSLRHFPVHDEAHARNALSRAPQSPFGDKAMPKIKAAAKKFGIDSDTSKGVIAAEETSVDTVTQGTESLTKSDLEAAVTKAMAPLEKRIESLNAELAKVKAQPIPGGPMMSVARTAAKADDGTDWAAKSVYFRQMADSVNDPATADGYRQLARQADDKANA